MAFVYRKGKSPYWYAGWTVDGKRHDRSTKLVSKRLALDQASAWELAGRGLVSSMAGPDRPPIRATSTAKAPCRSPSIQEVAEAFVGDLRKSRPPKSVANDISRLRCLFGDSMPGLGYSGRGSKHRKPMIVAGHLDELTRPVIENGLGALPATAAPNTYNNYRELLYRFVEFARARFTPDLHNPVADVRPRRIPDRTIEFLEIGDIDPWLAALSGKPSLRCAVATLIYAGLRRSELLWLRLDDVDLANHGLHIRAKTIDGQSFRPKTGRGRWVPIADRLWAIIGPYIRCHGGGWLFPSQSGSRYSPDAFTRAIARIRKEHGLRGAPWLFRHTIGTHMLERGASVEKVAAILGNSPQMVRRHYAAIIPMRFADEVNFDPRPIRSRPGSRSRSGDRISRSG